MSLKHPCATHHESECHSTRSPTDAQLAAPRPPGLAFLLSAESRDLRAKRLAFRTRFIRLLRVAARRLPICVLRSTAGLCGIDHTGSFFVGCAVAGTSSRAETARLVEPLKQRRKGAIPPTRPTRDCRARTVSSSGTDEDPIKMARVAHTIARFRPAAGFRIVEHRTSESRAGDGHAIDVDVALARILTDP